MTLIVALVFLVSVVLVNADVSMHNPYYCYSTDPIRPLIHMHSARTSYEAVLRASVDPTASSCTLSRFWFVGRHGGRFPDVNTMQEMIGFAESSIQADIVSNYDAGRTTLCRRDFETIRDWRREENFTIEYTNVATQGSVVTMQNIARSYQQFFPTLLTEDYSPGRYFFRHSQVPQTNTSIRAFASGLFGENGAENVSFEDIPELDSLLYPTHFCPEFREEVADQHQVHAFEQGPEFEEMLEQVNRKLGLRGSNQLSTERVLVMWEWCRYETGAKFELSDSEIGENIAWCAPFSIAHHMILEYWDELRQFNTYGYGVRNQRLVENLNCGLVQDLLTSMESNNNADQPVRIFVTQSQMLQALMVTFGLFKDYWPLHEHNLAQQTARQWLTSVMTPQGANLVVVRYDCADGDHDLLFLLNESPLVIPGCGTDGICKLSFILNRFQRFIGANCEQLFCSSDRGGNVTSKSCSIYFHWRLLVFVFVFLLFK